MVETTNQIMAFFNMNHDKTWDVMGFNGIFVGING